MTKSTEHDHDEGALIAAVGLLQRVIMRLAGQDEVCTGCMMMYLYEFLVANMLHNHMLSDEQMQELARRVTKDVREKIGNGSFALVDTETGEMTTGIPEGTLKN